MSSTKKEMRKNAKMRAKAVLTKEDNRLKISVAVLICISLTMMMWLVSGLSDLALEIIFGITDERFYYPVSKLSFVFLTLYLVAPIYVGTFRMSVNMLKGNNCDVADIFDTFSSFKAYNRALRLSYSVFFRILPIIIALRIHVIMSYLSYWLVFYDETVKMVDIFFVPCAFLLLLWFCGNFGKVSFAYLNESKGLRASGKMARKFRKGNRGSIVVLTYETLFKLILSLLTLGIVTIIHTIPLAVLTYGALADEMRLNYQTKTERIDI